MKPANQSLHADRLPRRDLRVTVRWPVSLSLVRVSERVSPSVKPQGLRLPRLGVYSRTRRRVNSGVRLPEEPVVT